MECLCLCSLRQILLLADCDNSLFMCVCVLVCACVGVSVFVCVREILLIPDTTTQLMWEESQTLLCIYLYLLSSFFFTCTFIPLFISPLYFLGLHPKCSHPHVAPSSFSFLLCWAHSPLHLSLCPHSFAPCLVSIPPSLRPSLSPPCWLSWYRSSLCFSCVLYPLKEES